MQDDNQRGKRDGGPAETAKRLEFLWNVHGYINEYIRFADTKAALVIAIASGLIASLYSAKAHHFCFLAHLSWRDASLSATVRGIGASSAFLLLTMSFVLGVLAVSPRLWEKPQHGKNFVKRIIDKIHANMPAGFVYWDSILRHRDMADFQQKVSQQSETQFASHVAGHVYVLSDIASRKYRYVNRAIGFGAAGAAISILVLFSIK